MVNILNLPEMDPVIGRLARRDTSEDAVRGRPLQFRPLARPRTDDREHEHRRKDETPSARRATVIVAVLCRGAPGQRRRMGTLCVMGTEPKSLDPRASTRSAGEQIRSSGCCTATLRALAAHCRRRRGNSGPVISGSLGEQGSSFDIWGDSMNVAATFALLAIKSSFLRCSATQCPKFGNKAL
jgi:hypothetical protein